jgi:hypothetical protein
MSLQVTQALNQLLSGVRQPYPGQVQAPELQPQNPDYMDISRPVQRTFPVRRLQPQPNFTQNQPQVGVIGYSIKNLADIYNQNHPPRPYGGYGLPYHDISGQQRIPSNLTDSLHFLTSGLKGLPSIALHTLLHPRELL